MPHKPDNRSDNVENIQFNINHTIQNIEQGEEMIAHTSDQKLKQELTAKNARREAALSNMKEEIRDEALDQEKFDG